MRDVIFHLADQHMEAGFRAFFARDNWHHVLGCSRFGVDPESPRDIYRRGGHTDCGIWKHAHNNLLPFKDDYRYAVIVLDADFEPHLGAEKLREDITKNMLGAGWPADSFCVVVIDKELEAWLWAPNVNVARAFGHSDFDQMREALAKKNLWNAGAPKPNDLKAARNLAAKLGGKKTGGPIFRGVFEGISRRACDLCEEKGFIAMRQALRNWFPQKAGGTA
jgi:hypothetical protein